MSDICPHLMHTYQGMNKEAAMATLMQVVNAYKPGQGDIDSGGFKVLCVICPIHTFDMTC